MVRQLMVFGVVWGMILILFLGVGQLLFYELTDFKDIVTTMTFLI